MRRRQAEGISLNKYKFFGRELGSSISDQTFRITSNYCKEVL